MSESPVAKWARVTERGAITPGGIGEVLVEIRGGRELFYALEVDGGTVPAGEEVVVVDYRPPRTVIVARVERAEERS